MYVANERSATASQYAIGAQGRLSALTPTSVATGPVPYGIAVTPNGRNAYVVNIAGNSISQYTIDPASGGLSPKTPPRVAAGPGPRQIALSPDGRSAYVTDGFLDANTVSQYDIDPASGKLSPKSPPAVPAGRSPLGVVVTPDSKSVYVANQGGDDVSQYDADPVSGKLSPKSPPAVPAGVGSALAVAVTPDGKTAYAATFASGISQYDIDPVSGNLSPKSPETVPAGFGPLGLAVTSDGRSAYAVNSEEGFGTTISQYDIDPASGELSPKSPATVPTGTGPTSIALSPDDQSAYVTNFQTNSNHVSQYDIGVGGKLSPKSPPTVTAGNGPGNIAVSPPQPGGPVWEAGHTDPASGCSAKVQSPYLDANQQVTAYTKVFCPLETRLTIRSRLRSDHRFDRPLFRNITVAQKGCLAASCVVNQPAGTRFYKLTCPKSNSRTFNQKYFTDIVIYAGTSPSAGSPFPQRSRPSTLSPFCAS